MTSLEIIFHFTCEVCRKWWSVAQESIDWKPEEMYCPHCGYKQLHDPWKPSIYTNYPIKTLDK